MQIVDAAHRLSREFNDQVARAQLRFSGGGAFGDGSHGDAAIVGELMEPHEQSWDLCILAGDAQMAAADTAIAQ